MSCSFPVWNYWKITFFPIFDTKTPNKENVFQVDGFDFCIHQAKQ